MLLGLARAVVEDVWFEQQAVIVSVRPKARERDRCPHCGRRCPGYDRGQGAPALAGVGFRHDAAVLGGTGATGGVQAPRCGCRGGAVGQARLVVHGRLRRSARVAWGAHF